MSRIALRLHAVGALALGTAFGALGFADAFWYVAVADASGDRIAWAAEMEAFARQFTYLEPPPIRLDTLGGFVLWGTYPLLVAAFGVWAVLAGVGATRCDDERGITELALDTGLSRAALVVHRAAGFLLASLAGLALATLGLALGALGAGEPLEVGGLAGELLAAFALTAVGYALGRVAGELARSPSEAAAAGVMLLAGTYFLNTLGRDVAALGPYRVLSPFHAFDATTSLLPGGRLDEAATLALLVVAAALVALSAATFARRDVGAPLLRLAAREHRPVRASAGGAAIGRPIVAELWQHRAGLLFWCAGLAGFAAYILSVVRTTVAHMLSDPFFATILAGRHGDPVTFYMSAAWFGAILPLTLTAYAITRVARWAAEDGEGVLELRLSAPVGRARVVAERAVALLAGAALLVVVDLAVLACVGPSYDVRLAGDRLALASLLLLPLVAAVGGVGSALAAFRPRLAVGGIALYASVSYFTLFFTATFGWPAWVRDTSVFGLYGTPLTEPVDPGRLALLIGVAVAGWCASALVMLRRDVGR